MGYKMYDRDGKEVFHHDLQDKSHWCRDGEKLEEAFVRLYGEQLNVAINPQKKEDPYAPDLISTKNGALIDLKYQSTPFFKAGKLYGIDPTYAVVFNHKDRTRYQDAYPGIYILYWVDWKAVKFEMGNTVIEVAPLQGIYATGFSAFAKYLASCHLHEYQQRIGDMDGNARDSYVCDIRNPVFKKLL